MVIANVGTPQNARSALVSPNVAPHTGFLRLAFSDPEERKLSQAEIADEGAGDPRRANFPASKCSSTRAGSSRASSRTATRRRSSSRCASDNLDELDAQAKAVAEVARTSRASATCASRSRSTTPRSTSTPTARRPASWA